MTRHCDNPHEAAMILANEIALKSPTAARAAKKLLNEVWHGKDEARGLLRESDFEMTLVGSENQMKAISVNFEQRKPVFKNPV